MTRRKTRQLMLGRVGVGSDFPVSVQSMATVPLAFKENLIAQIARLEEKGCDIVRVALDSEADAPILGEVCRRVGCPVVADIQFCAAAAAAAIRCGAAGVRVNPGLFRDDAELETMARLAAERNVPIRVGANSGSIGKPAIERGLSRGLDFPAALGAALVEGALRQCEKLERFGVRAIKVALKASSVPVTLAACREFAARTDYPLHLGVTEAGTPRTGVVKSCVGIGTLLNEGIGDTIRVSLTAPPEEEVTAGIRILEACGLRDATPEIVSCPTCGRTEIDLFMLAEKVEELVDSVKASGKKISLKKIAVMGCPVNGPGEAREADLGLAGSRDGKVLLFSHGKTLGVYPEAEALERLRRAVEERSV
ncbi:MAG: flavodoxin-dependent (E)-4-hydroxy-3-methylbut-2-enyl-diphosphate synthase [Victivallaceae bacterium]|nr:flavodoxin-dependent (E)-4-hydroxy-3-methylbut-2-enyl-diphosphate synthase [Victivallaceae bacterium]